MGWGKLSVAAPSLLLLELIPAGAGCIVSALRLFTLPPDRLHGARGIYLNRGVVQRLAQKRKQEKRTGVWLTGQPIPVLWIHSIFVNL